MKRRPKRQSALMAKKLITCYYKMAHVVFQDQLYHKRTICPNDLSNLAVNQRANQKSKSLSGPSSNSAAKTFQRRKTYNGGDSEKKDSGINGINSTTASGFSGVTHAASTATRTDKCSKRRRDFHAGKDDGPSAAKVKCEPPSSPPDDSEEQEEETFYVKSEIENKSSREKITRSGMICRRPLTRSQAAAAARTHNLKSKLITSARKKENVEALQKLRSWTIKQEVIVPEDSKEPTPQIKHQRCELPLKEENEFKPLPIYHEQTLTNLGSSDSLQSLDKRSSTVGSTSKSSSSGTQTYNSNPGSHPSPWNRSNFQEPLVNDGQPLVQVDSSNGSGSNDEEVTCEVQ